tara:strand:+ start:56905 stop:58209 length:1305 start_codon:yes stop_codon:yes gene_type:complete
MKVKQFLNLNYRLLLVLIVCIATQVDSWSQDLMAGVSKRKITPEPLIAVSGGVGKALPATEKKGDLYVRVLALAKNDIKVAIVSVDNLGWPAALGNKTRQLVSQIPADNILIGATHTHSAPDAYAFPDETGEHSADLEYLDWCASQMAEAINEALENLKPVHLKIGHEKVNGKISYNYYAPDLYDPRCGIIQAIHSKGENKGKVLATLINYAIHPEVIGNKRGIMSPDLIGPLNKRIEELTGGMSIFMNGAQGGMVTADNRLEDGKEANNWEECKRIGHLLADEALRILEGATLQTQPDLFIASKKVQFPVESEMMQYILTNSPLALGSGDGQYVTTNVNLINLGTAQMITIPGEALPNIGYYLKRKMPTPHTFLLGLTNDAFGYILTKEDFNSFERYQYVSRTSLGEMTGDIFVNEALDLIKNSNKPQKQNNE